MSNSGAVLVTGASGFVGRALVEQLVGRSFDAVIAAVREKSCSFTHKVKESPGLDIGRDHGWEEVLNGVSVVVHCAARVHVMNDPSQDPLMEFRRANVEGTLRVAKMAASAGVKRFVFLSSIKVNGESTEGRPPFIETDLPMPKDPYGFSKLEAEEELSRFCARESMELVVVRPPLVYGPGVKGNFEMLLQLAETPWPLPFGCLNNRRSMIYLGNLVDGISCLCTEPAAANKTFLISDDEDFTFRGLVRELRALRGQSSRLVPVPKTMFGLIGKMVGKEDVVRRLTDNLLVNSSSLRNKLNWKAPYSAREGLARTLGIEL